MARITITLDTDNAAFFTDNAPNEIQRILKDAGQRIANVWGNGDNEPEHGAHGFFVKDFNGNRVGEVQIV